MTALEFNYYCCDKSFYYIYIFFFAVSRVCYALMIHFTTVLFVVAPTNVKKVC